MNGLFLINIETDTLISLYPKGMVLEVKNSFVQRYYLSKERFVFLYFLVQYRPHAVNYKELTSIFESVDKHFLHRKDMDKSILALKKELKSYGVSDFIVKVKKVGYCVSNKWVPPQEHTEEAVQKRWANLSKLVNIILPIITKE